MASPVDASRVGTNITGAAGSHNLNVGSPSAGTLLIMNVRFMAAAGAITFSGWTSLSSGDLDASDDVMGIYYRWADGSEGATQFIDPAGSSKGASVCWQITGAENPSIQPPEISTVAVGTTTLNTANPGSRTVTGGPKDVLYLALMSIDGATKAPTVAPTNYTNLATANSGTSSTPVTNGSVGGASRQILNSSSDDPGVFTHPAANSAWAAWTVVIHPAPPPAYIPVGFAVGRDY